MSLFCPDCSKTIHTDRGISSIHAAQRHACICDKGGRGAVVKAKFNQIVKGLKL